MPIPSDHENRIHLSEPPPLAPQAGLCVGIFAHVRTLPPIHGSPSRVPMTMSGLIETNGPINQSPIIVQLVNLLYRPPEAWCYDSHVRSCRAQSLGKNCFQRSRQ